ncbi:hypothetical protein BDD43_4724 [Mucilaginibacter gracilis]|uniref:Uncharacterized protein n=1 Tax=Mucilaginibacter gracilis TaxID=423350 RepID=A0A495J675_9SPHI|nr:hypothetical protein [Mucilaginibacter gracilis]RKR84485.1 hypothetical protein BDD43_4724 [Mucilaginibacter gracilis]
MISSKKIGIILGLFVLYSAVAQGDKLSNGVLKSNSRLYLSSVSDFLKNKDTSTFNLTNYGGTKVLDFDDNNTINIISKGIKLIVKEESEDSYTLLVNIKGKLILSKKHIKGISKVFIDKDYLLFSIFTYVDEDGNNEGNGYILNLNNNSVKAFSRQLKNTCNPLIMNSYVYFIDGLSLIKTDLDFKSQKSFRITYLSTSKKKSLTYLDKYLICRLSKQDSTKLVIDFAPDKSLSKCKSYCGNVDASSKVILLK